MEFGVLLPLDQADDKVDATEEGNTYHKWLYGEKDVALGGCD